MRYTSFLKDSQFLSESLCISFNKNILLLKSFQKRECLFVGKNLSHYFPLCHTLVIIHAYSSASYGYKTLNTMEKAYVACEGENFGYSSFAYAGTFDSLESLKDNILRIEREAAEDRDREPNTDISTLCLDNGISIHEITFGDDEHIVLDFCEFSGDCYYSVQRVQPETLCII